MGVKSHKNQVISPLFQYYVNRITPMEQLSGEKSLNGPESMKKRPILSGIGLLIN